METYKTGTVNTIINENGVDLGSINVNLYTMDNKTSVIDIHIKKKNIINENQEYISVNFNQTKFEPVLHVFAQDGSIFTNEPLEIVKAEEGFVRYIIPEYITKHVGQMQCKLFLENPENNDSTHVANFYFTVNDSGITKSVGKEIRVELLDDIVEKVMKDNVDIFKGPKGDTGWIPLAIKNDYKIITDLNYKPSYRVIDYGNYKKVFVRLGVIDNSPRNENVVASIPKELNPYDVYGFGVSHIHGDAVKLRIAGGDITLKLNAFYENVDVYYQGEWII